MSSKRRLRRRQCTHKRRFDNQPQAERMLGRLASIGRLRPGLHVYHCPFCRGYHLGRADKQFKQKGRLKLWEWNQGV